jgi:serine/threonine protein phosphatase PrpC
MTFDIDIGFHSAAGQKTSNEDFCGANFPAQNSLEMGAIAAVSDGVSSGGMGQEAAQTSVLSLLRDYYDTPKTWDTTVALDRIITANNSWLVGMNNRRHPAMGMTTLTTLVMRGQSYVLGHIGDTRAYLLRDGALVQLTHDHVVNHVDFAHQLLRAVGLEQNIMVDYTQGDLQINDVFVLMTDGVHGSLNSRHIQTILNSHQDSHQASEALVESALKAGSRDNATALVVRVKSLLNGTIQDIHHSAKRLDMPAQRLKVGSHIDGLLVTAIVADNGINVLYQVRDPQTLKLYALKTLHPARAHDHDERAMLVHEAWLSQNLRSKHLVQFYSDGILPPTRSAFYLLFDWHAGVTLQQKIDSQKTPEITESVAIGMQALKALSALHRQGVIHRDIKPANLHLGDDQVLRILDLGVALSGKEPESMRKLHAGTPSFVNPEQWGFHLKTDDKPRNTLVEPSEELPDAQSDLFALGVTLYQLLTLKMPYGDVLPYQVGRYYKDPTSPSRHNPSIPIWLNHVLLKAVARDKKQRFETAEEFLLALERGASRPLSAPQASPLLSRDPSASWKIGLGLSLLFNFLLIYWLLFLPK